MKTFTSFLLLFFVSYIFCQTLLSSNTQTSSTVTNGVATTTTTQTNTYSNGSTVVTKTVTSNGQSTVTVQVTTNGLTNTYTSSGSSGSSQATLLSSYTQTSSSITNGISTSTVIVTNTYSNSTTVTQKTVTSQGVSTVTTTVQGPTGTFTYTSVGGSPSSPTPSSPTPSSPTPSSPTPSSPTPSSPTPSSPTPSSPTPSSPTPSSPTPSSPSPSGSSTKNPVKLASSDPYAAYNYAVPDGISYSDIKRVHLEYINGARDCLKVGNATWDDTLAAHAQAWANKCTISHANGGTAPANPSGNDPTIGEGENIYSYGGTGVTAVVAMQKGNTFFNSESANFDCLNNTCASGQTCGHYTQNVWSLTTRIGCGVAICGSQFYGVCRYAQRGNFNMPPYGTAHPLGSSANCNKGNGFANCKARISSTGRSLTSNQVITTNQNNTPSTPFFANDSQIVVFALAIVIAVLVLSILVLLIVTRRRTTNKELEYQLLESK